MLCPCRMVQASKSARNKARIPLGKKGINCLNSWNTAYHDDFKSRSATLGDQTRGAEHIKSLMSAPTATSLPLTRSWATVEG